MSLRTKNSNPIVAGDQILAADFNESVFSGNEVATYPLGESFTGATTPQPAVLINDIVQPFFDGIAGTFGAAATPYRAAKIIPRQAVSVASVITQLYRGTDPSTNLSIEIQSDTAGVPSGTPVTNGTSATVASSTLKNTEFRIFNFTFSTPPVLVAGTTYWVVFKVSATNANQFTVPTLANANKYGSFDGAVYNGTTWSAAQVIPYFEIVPSAAGSFSLWRADGNGVAPLGNFEGFCVTTGAAGATGTLIKSGGVTGFSGLATGAEYYVSNTIGTLTLNKNEGVFAGIALNATDLMIPKSRHTARNSNWYTGMIISGEATNPWYSAIYYAPEDGYFTVLATASVKNSTPATMIASVMNTYVNATQPGTAIGYVSTAANQGDHAGTFYIPVKRGDRIQFGQSNAGGGGNSPSIGAIYFQPLS